MPRMLGVDIPNNKKIEVALTYLYGVGPAISKKVASRYGSIKKSKIESILFT